MQAAILLLLAAGSLDTARIEALTGAKGVLDEAAGVFKVSVPRTDLAVSAAGVRLTPPMGLTSWAAFQSAGAQTSVMGDQVLLEDQVNPVMGAAMGVNTWAAFAGSDERAVVDGDFAMREGELQGVLRALRRADIDVAAIHHHMAGEEPRILFLHYWGVGRTDDLARGLRAALDVTGPPARAAAAASVVFVCEHGSVKSLIAQEWFNRLARERGLEARAVSRGLTPDSSVPPVIADALRSDGFEVGAFQPRALAAPDLLGVARVVAIGVDLGAVPAAAGAPVEKWEDIPPATQGYTPARDAIKARIEALIASLTPGDRERK